MTLNRNLLQNKRFSFVYFFLIVVAFFSSCTTNVVDTNSEIPERKWTYRNHIVTTFDIADDTKPYNVFFKLRHTADYRYANIFVLIHFKDGKNTLTKRYQYKLAKNDGEWLGSGSGNIFNYTLPVLTNYHFPHKGKFSIEIEQNMRDNPLAEICDAGFLIEQAK